MKNIFLINIILVKILSCLILLFFYLNYIEKNENFDYDQISLNISTYKNLDKEYKDIQDYMDSIFNSTKYDKNKIYYHSKNPKISIVISVYNGEAYLKSTILSIQNQDLKDIEIIIIDDCSKDNSVSLIKELMKTEPRIVLYQNDENKGILFTKSKGVSIAKGKYVMILDEDDLYVQRDAFTTLFVEAEKNKLDILGFFGVRSHEKISRYRQIFPIMNRIIYQPELSNLFNFFDNKGAVKQSHLLLNNLFINTNLYKKIIDLIDEKTMNTNLQFHDDLIFLFLLTRNANNIKFINRLFYVWFIAWKQSDQKVKFRNNLKYRNRNKNLCFCSICLAEVLFKKTKNTYKDKKIAFSQLEFWYLNTKCKAYIEPREKTLNVLKLFLDSNYISNLDKEKIKHFINNDKIS